MPSICVECIGDAALRDLLEKSFPVNCSFCGTQNPGVTLEELANTIDGPLRRYIQIGDTNPVFSADSDKPYFEQEGESLVNLLEEELGIPYEAAEELAEILIDQDPAWPPDGEEPFFQEEMNYRRIYLPPSVYAKRWEEFSSRIKHERRFFDEGARVYLAGILGEPGSSTASELPIFEVGPGSRCEVLFRSRCINSEKEAQKILKDPVSELGPPPPHLATAGRMNAAGIPVFYSALSTETAVAEVRPSVGSIVVVGGFRPMRKLRLLDLSQIGIGFTGSLFSPGYADRAARRRFLETFHALIARPIQRSDESLEYIPTQAVAEYVANVLMLDGILYASAQVGAAPEIPEPSSHVHVRELSSEELAQHNVVIFGIASSAFARESATEESHKPAQSVGFLAVEPGTVHAQLVLGVKYSTIDKFISKRDDGVPGSEKFLDNLRHLSDNFAEG